MGGIELVRHIPIELSVLLYHFLNHSKENVLHAVVTGKCKREVGLVIPAKYTAETDEENKTAEKLNEEVFEKKSKYTHFEFAFVKEDILKGKVVFD